MTRGPAIAEPPAARRVVIGTSDVFETWAVDGRHPMVPMGKVRIV